MDVFSKNKADYEEYLKVLAVLVCGRGSKRGKQIAQKQMDDAYSGALAYVMGQKEEESRGDADLQQMIRSIGR